MEINWKSLEELAIKALAGDRKAYDMFLRTLAQILKPRFQLSLPDQAADEALQETLIAIHKSLHTLDPAKPIAPWVYSIARYKANDQMRKIYRDEARGDELDEEMVSGEELGEVSANYDLKRMLNKLAPRDAEVLTLLKVEEYSVHEISKKLGIGESNVKVIAHRALQKLRMSITEEAFHAHG